MKFKQIDNNQIRFLTDIRQTYQTFLDAKEELTRFKGSMKWKITDSGTYLIRVLDSRGTEKSLGKKDTEKETVFENFNSGKAAAQARLEILKTSLARMSAMAKAADLGRLPAIVGKILRKLEDEKLLGEHIIVVGTHALYAYEAAAGVQFDSEMLATADVDLLIDSRKQLKLMITDPAIAESGILGVLCKADKSFKKLRAQTYTAANNQGFMVDLIKPALNPPWKKDALQNLTKNDLRPVEVPNLDWLLSSQRFNSIVIDTAGIPAKMVCPDPRAFAVHKKWISTQAGREAEKRSRDSFQAQAVIELTASKFTHLPLRKSELSYFPSTVLESSEFDFDL